MCDNFGLVYIWIRQEYFFRYTIYLILGTGKPFIGALQMAFVGSIAAGAAYLIAKAIPQEGH